MTVAQTDATQTFALKVSVTVGSVTVTKDFEVKVMAKANAIATFNFGANGDAAHVDGTAVGEEGITYTEGSQTLVIAANPSKVYDGARDAKGNSCIKLGTGSAAASFSFTVGADVKQVIINVAGYKANNAKLNVNGVEYTVTTASADGNYTAITIDTSATKTVNVETLSGGYRAMIDSIVYMG